MLVKDFDHFVDRREFEIDTTKEGNKIMSNMMTALKGEQWKRVRSIMSPAFTSGKLKAMVPLIQRVGDDLIEFLAEKVESGEDFGGKETLTSYTLDCLATCGFGVEANSFKEPNGVFLRTVMQATGGEKDRPRLMFNGLMYLLVPKLAKALGLSVVDDDDAMTFFADVVRKAIDHRQKTKQKRGDLIDLVLEALENAENIGMATGKEEENGKGRLHRKRNRNPNP